MHEQCEGTEAKEKCRRTCKLCEPMADSGRLLWYNQHQNLPWTMQKPATPFGLNDHDISSDIQGDASASTLLHEETGPAQAFVEHKQSAAHSLFPCGSTDDEVGDQQTEFGTSASHGLMLAKSPAADERQQTVINQPLQKHARKSAMTDGRHPASASVGNHVSSNKLDLDSTVAHKASRGLDEFAVPLKSPFCMTILYTCVLLLVCVTWLAKGRSRRRKSRLMLTSQS